MKEIEKMMKKKMEVQTSSIPQTIAPQPKPNYTDLVKTKYSRLSQKNEYFIICNNVGTRQLIKNNNFSYLK